MTDQDFHERLSKLGYDWMAVTIALVLWASAAAMLSPPGAFSVPRLFLLLAALVVSAVLVAAREISRSPR